MVLRTGVLLISLLLPTLAVAKTQRLVLIGVVPLKAEVNLSQIGADGKPVLQNLSSASLRYTVTQRSPASIVTVEAP